MDTLSLATNSSITEEQLDVLNRIRRNIKRSENEYALYFVECNLPNLREQLINELNSTNDLNLLTLNITNYPKDKGLHIDEWVDKQKIEYQSKNIKQLINGINIVGLEQLLPTDSNQQIIKTVSELNWRRSYFQALGVPIIFWLPSYALALLANQASDFYDWYSDIYHFDSAFEQKEVAYTQQALSLYHPETNIPAHEYQSKEEKVKQVRQLNALLDETNNKNDVAYIRNQIGLLLLTMGDLKKALSCFQEAYAIFQELDCKLEAARTLNNISQIFIKEGEANSALIYLQEALEIVNENSDETVLSVTFNSMGEAYDILHNNTEALKYYEYALKICERLDEKTGVSATLNNIASIYYTQGDYKSAFVHFKRSLAISRKIGSKLGLIAPLVNMASIYEIYKDYDNALLNYYESLNISEEIGEKLVMGTSLYSIANIYRIQGDYIKASNYLRKSVIIFELLDDKKCLAYGRYNLGFILKELDSNLCIEANEYLYKAYLLAKELGLRDIISDYSKRVKKPQ